MSRSGRGALLAIAALAAGVAAPAGAVDVDGALSAGYERSDTHSAGSSTSVPGWDFGGQLRLGDAPFRPGLLRWSGNAEYRHDRVLYSEGTSRANNFLYGASADLFTNDPLSITLNTSRARLDFTNDLATRQTGTTYLDSTTAGATLTLDRLPTLRGSFVTSNTDNQRFDLQSKFGTRQVNFGATQAVGPVRYQGSYTSDWNTGTFAPTNFRSHQLSFESAVALGEKGELQLNDRYFLRIPTVDAPTNPRIDDNSFNGSVRWRENPRLQFLGSYLAQRSVAEISGAADRESNGDALSSSAEYWLTPKLSMTGLLGAARVEERLADVRARNTNESIGAGLNWNDQLGTIGYGLGGTASIALVQWSDRGSSVGHAVGSQARIATASGRWTTGATYDVNHTRDVGITAGTALWQLLSAHAEYALQRASSVRWNAQFAETRRDAPLFGKSTTRTASTGVGYGVRRYSAMLSAGYSEGVSSSLTRIDATGAVILPAELASRTRYLNLTATAPVLANLWLTGLVRTLWSDVPGLPRQQESGLSLVADYRLGAITISADERYSRSDAGAGTGMYSANIFVLRVTRSFGATF